MPAVAAGQTFTGESRGFSYTFWSNTVVCDPVYGPQLPVPGAPGICSANPLLIGVSYTPRAQFSLAANGELLGLTFSMAGPATCTDLTGNRPDCQDAPFSRSWAVPVVADWRSGGAMELRRDLGVDAEDRVVLSYRCPTLSYTVTETRGPGSGRYSWQQSGTVTATVPVGCGADAPPRPVLSGILRDAGGFFIPIPGLRTTAGLLPAAAAPISQRLAVHCVDAAGTAVPCEWRLRVEGPQPGEADMGGHASGHHEASRPIGYLDEQGGQRLTEITRARAEAAGRIDYRTPAGLLQQRRQQPVGQRLAFTVECPSEPGCQTVSWPVDIKVPGLVSVPNTDLLRVRGESVAHPANRFAMPAFARLLGLYAALFRAELAPLPPEKRPRLTINELSLPFGGVFDIATGSSPAGDWLSPHANHSMGTAADLRINFQSGDTQLPLSDAELALVRRALHVATPFAGRYPVRTERPDAPIPLLPTHWHLEMAEDAPSPVTGPFGGSLVVAPLCEPDVNTVRATVTGSVTPAPGGYRYAYALSVAADSGSPVDAVALRVAGAVTDVAAPAGWAATVAASDGDALVLFRADPTSLVGDPGVGGEQWVSSLAVPAGGSLDGFAFTSATPPTTVPFSAMGRGPAQVFETHEDAEAHADTCGVLDTAATGTTTGPGPYRRYLAEGATGTFFDTRLALFNPSAAPALAQVRFLTDTGATVSHEVPLPAFGRRTVVPGDVPGLQSANFSTVVESAAPIVVDRTMSWDVTGFGSHAETSRPEPATTWYLAEGSTSGDFALFYLLQNPNDTAVSVTVRYLRPFGAPPIERTYAVAPRARRTIAVDDQGELLASTDVSAVITATAPIIAERAMYKSTPGQVFAAGHGSAGVTAPATRWFLAEGATGPFFDLFLLLANPGATAAAVRVDYLLSSGAALAKTYSVPAHGRVTIWVDDEQLPAGSGLRPLANVAVSATVTSTNAVPIIVERTMWWPGPEMSPAFWTEAHNSAGTTATATRWALAEGEAGGARAAETYILIANTSAYPGEARVTLHFEDGTSAQRVVALPPSSRTNVSTSVDFPQAHGRRFGTLVESLGPTPAQLVVERAIYTSPGGQTWAAGTNAIGTPLP